MITFDDKFSGHIILYCKGHYNLKEVSLIDGFRRIWATRCGMNVEHINSRIDEYIADHLYRIIEQTMPNKLQWMWSVIHKELTDDWKFDGTETAIQRLIICYRNMIMRLQITEKLAGKKRKILVKLPKPQKRLFKRIVSGKGVYEDYKLVR